MLEKFLQALEITGWGMLGIFIVTGIIILTTIALNKVTNLKSKNKNKKD